MPDQKTIRLLMPQWQGGNNPTYQLGARMLAWLAPPSKATLVEVPVATPEDSSPVIEAGIFAKSALLRQTRSALEIIEREAPDRIVTFGGDCSVSLAPFAYLAAKYAGDVAVLWVDSHTDFSTSEVYAFAHGYPMRNLLGEGDTEFAAFAAHPIPGQRLIFAGVGKAEMPERTRQAIERVGATVFDPTELTPGFSEVVASVRSTGASKLLVHFDLDVLDPNRFRAQLFNNPDGKLAEQFSSIARGKLSLDDVVAMLAHCGEAAEIVGLSIAEHLPWDAENLRHALARLPILSG